MVPRVLAKRFLPIGTSLLIFIGTVLVLLTQQKWWLVIIPVALFTVYFKYHRPFITLYFLSGAKSLCAPAISWAI